MKTEIIQNLKDKGVDDQSAEELYELLSGEVLEILFEDLTEKSTDEELKAIETRIKNAKSVEHFETIIREIASTIYEDNAEEKIKNIYLELIGSVEATIKEATELLQRANAGDIEAQKLLEEAEQTDTYKNIVEEN